MAVPRIAQELDLQAHRVEVLSDLLERLSHKLSPVMTSPNLGNQIPKQDEIPKAPQSEIAHAINYRTCKIDEQIVLVEAILSQLEI